MLVPVIRRHVRRLTDYALQQMAHWNSKGKKTTKVTETMGSCRSRCIQVDLSNSVLIGHLGREIGQTDDQSLLDLRDTSLQRFDAFFQ